MSETRNHGSKDLEQIGSILKVHIFWEGHKFLQNLQQLFDWQYIGQIIGGVFANFYGLLRISELYLLLIMGAASICVWFFSMPRLLFGHLSRGWMVIGPAGSWSLMWEIMYQNGFIDGWPTDGWDISLGGRVGTAQWSIWWKMFSIIYGPTVSMPLLVWLSFAELRGE